MVTKKQLPLVAILFVCLQLLSITCYGQGPIVFDFSGTVQSVSRTITNPYSGEQIVLDSTYNVNNSSYVGDTGFDAMNITNLGDMLFIRDDSDNQVVTSVETFFAGDGNDVLHLADSEFILNNLTLLGGNGNDILWANVGDDYELGEGGDDHLVGGPGNDRLYGGDGNDYLSGGVGDDYELDGGRGDDYMIGGPGSDVYLYSGPFNEPFGSDIIVEDDSPELNIIKFSPGHGFTLDDLTFQPVGLDLMITVEAFGNITIKDQFLSSTSGIDQIVFDEVTGDTFDLRTLAIPEPTTLCLLGAGLLFLMIRKRRYGM